MKIINFISTLTPRHYKELNRWYQCTISALTIAILAMLTCTVHKLMSLHNLKKASHATVQTDQLYTQLSQEEQTLKTQEQLLNKQLATIADWSKQTTHYAHVLQILEQSMGDVGLIEAVTHSNDKVLLTFLCATAKQAMDIVKTLKKESLFANITLISLQPKQYAQQSVMQVQLKAIVEQ